MLRVQLAEESTGPSEFTLGEVDEGLAVNARHKLSLFVLDFKDKGIGIIWPVPGNSIENKGKCILFAGV